MSTAATHFSSRFWLLVVLTGIGAGIGGGLLMKLLYSVQHLAWSYESGSLLDAVRNRPAGWHVLILLGAGVLTGIVQWAFRKATGGQGGELSGIIWFHSGRIPPLRTLARAVQSIVIVGMGASLGREGALKAAGAVVASRLAAWARLSAPRTRILAAFGAGAGMAAAYNVPFGGALFALEVLLGGLALRLVAPALAPAVLATVVSWLLLPNRPTYTIPSHDLNLPLLVWALLAGPILGLAAVFFVRVIGWADAHKPQGWGLLVAPVLMFTGLGVVSVGYPELLGNGKNLVQLAFANQLGLQLLLTLPLLKLLATAGCLGSGAPGGLFTPTLAYGALLGGLLGFGWTTLWPDESLGSYAIVGSGAVLAAATQGPISALVLILELTWHINHLVVPLLIAIAGATLVAGLIEPNSIYSVRIRPQAVTAAVMKPCAAEIGLGDLFLSQPAVVSAATQYSELARLLLALPTPNSPLYVVDERGHLLGVIAVLGATQIEESALPLDMITASDLAKPVASIPSSTTREEACRRLKAANLAEMPVIDASSGQLVGVVALPAVPPPSFETSAVAADEAPKSVGTLGN